MIQLQKQQSWYDQIKEAKRKTRFKIKELLALSPNRDPFYVGSDYDREKAEWIAKIYNLMGEPEECHIRRMHYWLVSREDIKKPDGKPYRNTEKDWSYLLGASAKARYLSLIPIETIVDHRNPEPKIHSKYWDDENPNDELTKIDADTLADLTARQFYCYNPVNAQAYHLEVWEEKSTMFDKTDPVCEKFRADHQAGLGELSITAVYKLVQRVVTANKPVRVLYISDFDPAGEGMPISVARKIEWFIRTHFPKLNIKLKPLALTKTQCVHYGLPRTPIKESEKRKTAFEGRHGEGATELDALEALYPGQLASILQDALSPYFDEEADKSVQEANGKVRTIVHDAMMAHEDQLTEIIEALNVQFEPPRMRKAAVRTNHETWLFDSELDYSQQLKRYKEARVSS
jgi:hypothetical protein